MGITLHKCREKILDIYKFNDPLTFEISSSVFINSVPLYIISERMRSNFVECRQYIFTD